MAGLPSIASASDAGGIGAEQARLHGFGDLARRPSGYATPIGAVSDVVVDLGGLVRRLTDGNQAVVQNRAAEFAMGRCRTGLSLGFADEFDAFVGSPTGAAGWKTQGGVDWRTLSDNAELQYYSDSSVGVNPFSNADGVLTITAAPGANPLGLPYNSGIITTQGSYNFEYGLVEVSVRLPAGAGLWPAIWLLPSDLSWPPEIDIMEMLGDRPSVIYASIHSTDHSIASVAPVYVGDTSRSFHTYGLDWEPDTITWCFDGNVIRTVPTPPDMHQPMYLLINLAVGGRGSWPGPPNRATRFPAQMSIDSVRIYASPASTAISGTAVRRTAASSDGALPDHVPMAIEPPTAGVRDEH